MDDNMMTAPMRSSNRKPREMDSRSFDFREESPRQVFQMDYKCPFDHPAPPDPSKEYCWARDSYDAMGTPDKNRINALRRDGWSVVPIDACPEIFRYGEDDPWYDRRLGGVVHMEGLVYMSIDKPIRDYRRAQEQQRIHQDVRRAPGSNVDPSIPVRVYANEYYAR